MSTGEQVGGVSDNDEQLTDFTSAGWASLVSAALSGDEHMATCLSRMCDHRETMVGTFRSVDDKIVAITGTPWRIAQLVVHGVGRHLSYGYDEPILREVGIAMTHEGVKRCTCPSCARRQA